MKVKTVTNRETCITIAVRKMTQEQLQIEFDYFQVKKITKELLAYGFIDDSEYDKIMKRNLRVFPTILAPLL